MISNQDHALNLIVLSFDICFVVNNYILKLVWNLKPNEELLFYKLSRILFNLFNFFETEQEAQIDNIISGEIGKFVNFDGN